MQSGIVPFPCGRKEKDTLFFFAPIPRTARKKERFEISIRPTFAFFRSVRVPLPGHRPVETTPKKPSTFLISGYFETSRFWRPSPTSKRAVRVRGRPTLGLTGGTARVPCRPSASAALSVGALATARKRGLVAHSLSFSFAWSVLFVLFLVRASFNFLLFPVPSRCVR